MVLNPTNIAKAIVLIQNGRSQLIHVWDMMGTRVGAQIPTPIDFRES